MTLELHPTTGLQYSPESCFLKAASYRDVIESQSLTTTQKAEEAEYSKVTIIIICRNLRQFGGGP